MSDEFKNELKGINKPWTRIDKYEDFSVEIDLLGDDDKHASRRIWIYGSNSEETILEVMGVDDTEFTQVPIPVRVVMLRENGRIAKIGTNTTVPRVVVYW